MKKAANLCYQTLPSKLSCKIQKRLLEVVVALGWDFIVLKILLPMEDHLLRFHLPVLHVNLVPTEYNRNVLTHPSHSQDWYISVSNLWTERLMSRRSIETSSKLPAEIAVPCWDVLVGQPCCYIKHYDSAIPMDTAYINKNKIRVNKAYTS